MRGLVIMLLMHCVLLCLQAQNNALGISNDLFKIYEAADKLGSDTLVAEYADSLIRCAKAKGEPKAECAGWMLMLHRAKYSDETFVRNACDSLKKAARRVGSLQYYYYASTELATYLISRENVLGAVDCISKLREDSYNDGYRFGIYSCHRLLGDLNNLRGNYLTAYNEYLRSLSVIKEFPEQLPAEAYQKCGQALYFLGRHEEALLYLDSCLVYKDRNLISCFDAYQYKCMLYFYMHRFDQYKQCYKEMRAYQMRVAAARWSHHEKGFWNMLNMYVDGRVNDAIERTKLWRNPMARYDLLMTFYEFSGDYGKAFLYCDSLNKSTMAKYGSTNGADIVALNAAINKSELELQAKDLQIMRDRLALENINLERNKENLELENTMLELGRTNAEVESQNTLLINYDLELANKSLSIKRHNIEMERQKAAIEDEKMDHEHNVKMTIILILSLILFIITTLLFVVHRLRAIEKLRYSNHELEKARRKADELRERAERSEQMKTLFLQNMSHDIRTPLNAICGFSQLIIDKDISEGLNDDQRRQFADFIVNNTDMLTTLVNDILNVSELESGRYKMNMHEVVVNDLCRMALKSVIHRKSYNVEMTFETNVSNDYVISTDGLRVQQVLTNFLTNAIKHTQKGEICLTCMLDEDGKNIVFAVRDTGEGIPADKSEQIFGRFEKLDSSLQATGLGLSICRLIAQHLNGEVSLDTSYVNGARFIFKHPID